MKSSAEYNNLANQHMSIGFSGRKGSFDQSTPQSRHMGVRKKSYQNDLRESINTNHNVMSQTSINKFASLHNKPPNGHKLTLAPKIKGGSIPMNKRNTDFPAHAGTLGIMN